jgi:release factor glutamine methyltransferase
MNIREALIKAQKQFEKAKISSAGLDAEILLLYSINPTENNIDKSWLYAHSEYELNKSRQKKFESFIKRRLKGEPITYVISRKEFFGLDFYVDKRVMIPRPETEIIVEKIVENAEQHKHFSNIIDIGTGSGCVSIALAKNIFQANPIINLSRKLKYNRTLFSNGVKFYAIDISKEAIEVAKINAKKNKVFSRIKFLKGNLLEPIQKIKIKNHPTIIIANLPYLKTKNIKKNIGLTYEPISALDGGKNGLEKIKELIIQLKKINFNIFECWIEINPEQTNNLVRFVKKKLGGVKIKIIKDLSEQNRFLRINTPIRNNLYRNASR